MNRRYWDLAGAPVLRDSRRSFLWTSTLPHISGCLKIKWCAGLAEKCLQISQRWSICVRSFRLFDFGESVQRNSTHMCVLVCKLYLNDKDDFVCLHVENIFPTCYFHVWNETERAWWHSGVQVFAFLAELHRKFPRGREDVYFLFRYFMMEHKIGYTYSILAYIVNSWKLNRFCAMYITFIFLWLLPLWKDLSRFGWFHSWDRQLLPTLFLARQKYFRCKALNELNISDFFKRFCHSP